MNFNPLEQFTVYSATSAMNILTITNIAIFVVIGLIIKIIFQITASSHLVKPTRWNIILEAWIASILGIIKDQIGKGGLIYFPLIFTLFSFVFISNILGMIPYSFTPTSHISVTLGLSIAIMIGVTLIGFEKHKLDFFSLFVPKGTPIALVPLLVLIEFISYSARAFSLALRLTANVSAGHCLFGVISMLSCSAFMALSSIIIKGLTITLPLLILIPLYGLELLVALLQSYVFTLLTCSYLSDIITMGEHH
jgi:F-type H+-transporting ATPase subunit a